jgi:hypothetical protein
VALLSALARPASAQPADLSPVDLDLVEPLIQRGRWVWLGDSFSVPSPARVSVGTLATWPLDRLGAAFVGGHSMFARLYPTGPGARFVMAEEGYAVARGSAGEGTMGVPVFRLAEWELRAGSSALGDLAVRLGFFDEGHAGVAGQAFVNARVRPLVYAHGGVQASGQLRLNGVESALPTSGFALGAATVLDGRLAELPLEASVSSSGFAHVAGTLIEGEPGHYAQFFGDSSWSYWGYAQDASPTLPDSAKRFRTDDLADILEATTLDPSQPSVAVLYLAPEFRAVSDLLATIEAAVARTRTAYARAGLPEPVVLLLHPHAVSTAATDTPEKNERAGLVMRSIALGDPGVAFFSLYEATDGVVFDGRPEARDWLLASEKADLSYGIHVTGRNGPLRLVADYGANLLDDARLHPTTAGAAFFSALLDEGITGRPVSCEAPAEGSGAAPLAPNPARPGGRVRGAEAGVPVFDVLGRLMGTVGPDGTFAAPRVPGVYLVDGRRLVVH